MCKKHARPFLLLLLLFLKTGYCKEPHSKAHVLVTVLEMCGKQPAYTPYDLDQLLFHNPVLNLRSQLRMCSFGKFDIDGYVNPYVISLPCTPIYPPLCNFENWASLADQTLVSLNATLDLSFYDHHFYIVPRGSVCNWAGQGLVGCDRVCKAWIASDYAGIIMIYLHELGHNLGLQHATSRQPPNEYGDTCDAMGSCCKQRCFNPIHTEQLGWTLPSLLLGESDFTGNKGKATRVTLFASSTSEHNYIKLQFPRTWVYIEFRNTARISFVDDNDLAVVIYSTSPWYDTDAIKPKTVLETALRGFQQYTDIIDSTYGTIRITLESTPTTASDTAIVSIYITKSS